MEERRFAGNLIAIIDGENPIALLYHRIGYNRFAGFTARIEKRFAQKEKERQQTNDAEGVEASALTHRIYTSDRVAKAVWPKGQALNVAKLQISGRWTKFPVDFSPESMILERLVLIFRALRVWQLPFGGSIIKWIFNCKLRWKEMYRTLLGVSKEFVLIAKANGVT